MTVRASLSLFRRLSEAVRKPVDWQGQVKICTCILREKPSLETARTTAWNRRVGMEMHLNSKTLQKLPRLSFRSERADRFLGSSSCLRNVFPHACTRHRLAPILSAEGFLFVFVRKRSRHLLAFSGFCRRFFRQHTIALHACVEKTLSIVAGFLWFPIYPLHFLISRLAHNRIP